MMLQSLVVDSQKMACLILPHIHRLESEATVALTATVSHILEHVAMSDPIEGGLQAEDGQQDLHIDESLNAVRSMRWLQLPDPSLCGVDGSPDVAFEVHGVLPSSACRALIRAAEVMGFHAARLSEDRPSCRAYRH